ncbi:hypothetical protein [Azospirillum tabaci]|uniref:hypothetical protein n=1 Tax=Azospirillum tabaci TaxID=2752310 RepID=UPI0016608F82|nr:hypothetical protein [Azospirillum tabaci]
MTRAQAHPFFSGIFGPDQHVFMASGGGGTFKAVQRLVQRVGTDHLTLLFCDTLIEHRDCYKLLALTAFTAFDRQGSNSAAHILTLIDALPEYHEDPARRAQQLEEIRQAMALAVPQLVWLADGRDPWTLFFERKFLGNSRVDLCSKELKRDVADRWLKANRDPAVTTVYLGMDWTEEHRFIEAQARYARTGYRCEAPLCEAPFLPADWKVDLYSELLALGIAVELYRLGFPHNNCGGFCIKAGQAFFALLLRTRPAVYAFHEAKEKAIRLILGDVSILKDRRGGVTRTLTLEAFRLRLEAGGGFDKTDFGSCGCMGESPDEPTGDVPLDMIYGDGSVQPLLVR